jgi:hypothetical protein
VTEPPFLPINPNPFIVGNPVRGRAMFFGRAAEFALVQKRFGDSAHGGLLVFCGERRSGKTSILFQILDRRLGYDFIPVLIDMQSMAVGNEAEFLTRLAEEVLIALGTNAPGVKVPDFTSNSNRSAVFQRFVYECLRALPGKKLILLFDEYELFETKIDAGSLSKDVLYILASLMENAPVFMIFTGSQHLEQRRRDYWNVLGKSIFKQVSFLERDDALSLIRQPVEGRVDYDDAAVESILRLAAGQPFYTQAICQSLVDHLNERQTRHAEVERVHEVVDGIVNNPLPQMIFLWDGLERLDKLVLALLAECLADGTSHCGVDDVMRLAKRRRYPLEIDLAAVATTLEKLFKGEMLLRDDRESKAAYAFRMDLWRLWIRRQHSVWQVLREEGLATRRKDPRRWAAAAIFGGLAVAGLVAGFLLRRPASGPSVLDRGGAHGFLDLVVEPAGAAINLNGRRVGMGALNDSVTAGVEHRVQLSAPGYADSTIVVRVAEGGRLARQVMLRPLVGDLRVETQPPNAEIRVDGRLAGRSPLTIPGLPVASPHAVEASLPGYAVTREQVSVQQGTLARSMLVLRVGTAEVLVTTEPSGAAIQVDGKAQGTTPVTLSGLSQGRHVVRASRAGRTPAETTVVVTAATRQLQLLLPPEAPGSLVVRGDVPAQIYVDDVLVVENVLNSGPRQLAPGSHSVRVVLVSGQTIDADVAVRSRERVVYDFSKNATTRKAEGDQP